ncbi:hypothetical protein GJ496_005462 [Pomphorhynchus laevis]|nr:hypothetical protein GJ496_005462 [Pomphorhynchus laevis]
MALYEHKQIKGSKISFTRTNTLVCYFSQDGYSQDISAAAQNNAPAYDSLWYTIIRSHLKKTIPLIIEFVIVSISTKLNNHSSSHITKENVDTKVFIQLTIQDITDQQCQLDPLNALSHSNVGRNRLSLAQVWK